jgi:hypothetical protein
MLDSFTGSALFGPTGSSALLLVPHIAYEHRRGRDASQL